MPTHRPIKIKIIIFCLVFVLLIGVAYYFTANKPVYFYALLVVIALVYSVILLHKISAYLYENDLLHDLDEHKYSTHLKTTPKLAYGHYDKLTSLPNRILFNRILNRAINHAKRHNKLLSIMVVGLDDFKSLSTKLGLEKTDFLLKEVSLRLMNILRTDDIIARLDNDEFIILLNDMNHAKYAGPVAEKILYASKEPFAIGSKKINTTFSIGIAIFPNDGDSLETLLVDAETALYSAKAAGGNRYKYHTAEMDVLSREHIELETALRHAIENKEFVLYFQPQYDLATSTIKSVEALIRWVHPKLGVMSPAQFIPLAEETGLISMISEWTLQEACKANKHWQQLGLAPITMAVNMSVREFGRDLSAFVKKSLLANRLDAEYLEIEITESEIVKEPDLTLSELMTIHEMGVQIAIDDFGSGYTSINYLRQFPLNFLKIDQSLIKQVENNKRDRAITKSIIELSHNLGFKVIAEGVETIEQVIFLSRYNCDYVQGYFFSRPLPEHKLIELLTKQSEG